MNMDMYWSQQEVFFMATLYLFDYKIKNVPLTPDGEWRRYFNSNTFEQIAQQLTMYKEAGYIDFVEETQKAMNISVGQPVSFGLVPISFVIKEVHTANVKSDLSKYLKNWCNDKLLTDTAYKPDNSAYQHDKLLAALARVYERQDMPHVSLADVFGDNADHEPPFWETVLAPQLIGEQYEIRQMGYDMSGDIAQPFVDIKIIDLALHRSLERAAKSAEPLSDEDPEEKPPYKGLQVRRDGLIYYNDKEVPFTPQQRDVMQVLLKRPEELRPREAFTDAEASIFNRSNYPNINETLAQLVGATHKKLRIAVGRDCIFNTASQGWKLKL
jgi:hypothetical protein